MEKVQIHLEATLPELKDLYDKGLFTKVRLVHLIHASGKCRELGLMSRASS